MTELTQAGDNQVSEPEQDPPKVQPYFVMFAMSLDAPTPGTAVQGMVEMMVEHGLRDWRFRVETPGAERGQPAVLVGLFDGYGNPWIDEEAAPTMQTVELPAEDVPTDLSVDSSEATTTVDDAGSERDEDLTAYAESLQRD